MATPARIHAAKNHDSVGARAIPTTAGTARIDPVVMIGRGPTRSSHRPTGMPRSADTTKPVENAAVVAEIDHPVLVAMLGARTGKA